MVKPPPKVNANDPPKALLTGYSTDKYFVNPIQEESKNNVFTINQNLNCTMIPILEALDIISNKKSTDEDYKPTKFITLVAVRQEPKYCGQIFSTLDFASNIKSS